MNRHVFLGVLLALAMASCARSASRTEQPRTPAEQPRTPAELFAGCTGLRYNDDGFDQVSCPSFLLSISRSPQEPDYEEFVVAYRAEKLRPDVSVESTELSTPHGRYVGLYSPADRLLLVIGPAATGGALGLECVVHEEHPRGQQDCQDVVSYVANHGPPPTIEFRPPPPPTFAGRTMVLDPSCVRERERYIKCDGGARHMSWTYARDRPSPLEDLRAELVEHMRQIVPGEVVQVQDDLPCLVEGVKASCMKIHVPTGRPTLYYLTIVDVRGERILLLCSHVDQGEQGTPSHCKDVLQLEPAAP